MNFGTIVQISAYARGWQDRSVFLDAHHQWLARIDHGLHLTWYAFSQRMMHMYYVPRGQPGTPYLVRHAGAHRLRRADPAAHRPDWETWWVRMEQRAGGPDLGRR